MRSAPDSPVSQRECTLAPLAAGRGGERSPSEPASEGAIAPAGRWRRAISG